MSFVGGSIASKLFKPIKLTLFFVHRFEFSSVADGGILANVAASGDGLGRGGATGQGSDGDTNTRRRGSRSRDRCSADELIGHVAAKRRGDEVRRAKTVSN